MKQCEFGALVRAASVLFPENYFLQTSRYRVVSKALPAAFEGFRIVQLSDLHGCSFGPDNGRLFGRVRSACPDLIVMTGDMADRYTPDVRPLFRFSEKLCGEAPVFFVSGNHEQEFRGKRRGEFRDGMIKSGVTMLDDTSVLLRRGEAAVRLSGLLLPPRYFRSDRSVLARPALTCAEIENRIGRREAGFTILLTHNPLFFPVYAEWGADLTLCGHIHGGMIRLPGVGGLLSPERSFLPGYSAGAYRSRGRVMIVSRGLAAGPRVGNRPEVVEITFSGGTDPGKT